MKVDFYILESGTTLQSWHFTCQQIEKLNADENPIYIHTQSKNDAEQLDQFLWTYREDSFLPHNIYQAEDAYPPSIQIGFNATPPLRYQRLVNLAQAIPEFYKQFNHIVEIVFPDPHVQQLARERYRQYRDKGAELNIYKKTANASI